MDSLFNPTRVLEEVTINKLNLASNRNMPRFVRALRNRRGFSTSKLYLSVMFLYPFSHRSPCFTDIHFAAFTWDLVNRAVLFLQNKLVRINQLNEKRSFTRWGLPLRKAVSQTAAAKLQNKKFIFQIGTLCYSPPPSQHHNCLRNELLYFKIIQLNIIIKKKKVTAIFYQFRLGLELETKQDIPPTK